MDSWGPGPTSACITRWVGLKIRQIVLDCFALFAFPSQINRARLLFWQRFIVNAFSVLD